MSKDQEGTFSYGWNKDRREFVLWKRGRTRPVAVIPFVDAKAMAATVAHVEAVQENREWAGALRPMSDPYRGEANR